VIVCQEGFQSSLAARTLQDLGFVHATDLDGGFDAWNAAGLPVEPADTNAI
jgi:rhodanese-related sulfurtransferase